MSHNMSEFLGMLSCALITVVGTMAYLIILTDSL